MTDTIRSRFLLAAFAITVVATSLRTAASERLRGAMLAGMAKTDDGELAAAIRRACIEILLDAHEDAGMQGLCAEGRFEAAVARLRATPIADLLARCRTDAQ